MKIVSKVKYFFSSSNNSPILSGIRVLDLSRILVGPICSQQLSDLGAEIIKVESFQGDETRFWGPPFVDQKDSAYFLSLNRNKKSICIDLKKEEGRQIIYDLTKKSDIFLENFSPTVTTKLKIDYEQIKQINSQIIYSSITGYGSTGPASNFPGFDLVIQAQSGFMSITGQPDGNPQKLGFAITDVLTGLFSTIGILSALLQRQKTGQGIFLETSLLECSLNSMTNIWSTYLNGKLSPKRFGNDHPTIVPYGVFKAKNSEFIVIGSGTNSQFKILCQVLKLGQLDNDPKYQANSNRVINRVELTTIIENAIQKSPLNNKELVLKLMQSGIPSTKIQSVEEAFDSEQVKWLQIVEEVEKKNYTEAIKQVRFPIRFDQEGLLNKMEEPPLLNEHRNYVLKDILGYSDSQINNLYEQQVIKK